MRGRATTERCCRTVGKLLLKGPWLPSRLDELGGGAASERVGRSGTPSRLSGRGGAVGRKILTYTSAHTAPARKRSDLIPQGDAHSKLDIARTGHAKQKQLKAGLPPEGHLPAQGQPLDLVLGALTCTCRPYSEPYGLGEIIG